jgi:uncharacterized RDD family membrane protein YckC
MESDINKITEAWKQATDHTVVKAATEDWCEYSHQVQTIIEAESKHRGLWEKVLYLRGNKTEGHTSLGGNLEGYVCKGCKGTYLNFETGRCMKCELPSDYIGYCIECDKFWSVPPGEFCPDHKIRLVKGKTVTQLLRLGNDIFDRMIAYLLIFLGALVFVFLGVVNPESFEKIDPTVDFVLSILCFFLYYVIFEAIWQRTPGKFITGTKVITVEGRKPSIGTIAKRTLIRFIPFEAFSFLGERVYGWHDKWSGTYVIKAKRFERKSVSQDTVSEPLLEGIGGWLILVAICLILTPILITKDLGFSILPAYAPNIWNAITTPGSENYTPYFAHLLIFETLANVILFVWSILLLYYFFGKKKTFPYLVIIFLLVRLSLFLVDSIATGLIFHKAFFDTKGGSEFAIGLIKPLGACMVWIPYFLKSERVKNTFVIEAKRREKSEPAQVRPVIKQPQPISSQKPSFNLGDTVAALSKKTTFSLAL